MGSPRVSKIEVSALAVAIASLLLTTPSAHAGVAGTFSGPWSVVGGDHPVGGMYTTPGASMYGAWLGTIQGDALIDTTLAPNSVSLAAPARFGLPGSGVIPAQIPAQTYAAEMEIQSAPADGTFSLNYTLAGTSHLQVFHGVHNTPSFTVLELTSGSTVSINFLAGESFGFRVIADVISLPARGIAQPAATGPQFITVSNPIIVVPETSTLAAAAGLCGVIGWRFLGNRRRQ